MKFQFDSFSALLSMEGHGMYVWISYAIVLIGMLYFGFRPNWQFKQFVKQQKRIQLQEQQIAQRNKQ
ncbi:heme exporter protein CcmD [Aurantivibrio plasticivorans]